MSECRSDVCHQFHPSSPFFSPISPITTAPSPHQIASFEQNLLSKILIDLPIRIHSEIGAKSGRFVQIALPI
ncbi:hypothetical protein ACHQM5_004056 [Ranunculus cassubicifolius]